MSPRPRLWTLLLATALVAGCGAADGGPVGTGIAASVIGNVVAVEDTSVVLGATAQADEPAASVAGIEVGLVELPDIVTRTDADGNFKLEGEFSGDVTLRFETEDFDVEQPLVIATGGVLVLSDIQLEASGVTVEAGRQLGLSGEVVSVDCSGGRIVVEDRDPRTGDFELLLLPETEFTRRGEPVDCRAIFVGETIETEGLVDALDQRTVTALTIDIAPSGVPSDPFRQVAFLGYVAARNCKTGVVTVENERHRFRVLLGPETEILFDDGRPVECGRIKLGRRVTGRGRLELRKPAILTAIRLIVSRATAPAVELRIRGFVALKECDRNVLQIGYPNSIIAVRLTRDTKLMPQRRCRGIPLGVWVDGRGLPSATIPGALDAIELKLKGVRS
ncbi:MAG: hypothetical protein FJ144_10095 [Deltaproteobacteria bacterium]|nr:hypothetical protein [Deltaproteobacteria bacterium]